VGLALAAGLALASCREDEQHRKLMFDKGHYAGPKIEEPSQQAIDAARKRVETQKF
jgi:hypothetical protein